MPRETSFGNGEGQPTPVFHITPKTDNATIQGLPYDGVGLGVVARDIQQNVRELLSTTPEGQVNLFLSNMGLSIEGSGALSNHTNDRLGFDNVRTIIGKAGWAMHDPEVVYMSLYFGLKNVNGTYSKKLHRLTEITDGVIGFQTEEQKAVQESKVTGEVKAFKGVTTRAHEALAAYGASAFSHIPEESREQYREVLEGLLDFRPTSKRVRGPQPLSFTQRDKVVADLTQGDIESAHALIVHKRIGRRR